MVAIRAGGCEFDVAIRDIIANPMTESATAACALHALRSIGHKPMTQIGINIDYGFGNGIRPISGRNRQILENITVVTNSALAGAICRDIFSWQKDGFIQIDRIYTITVGIIDTLDDKGRRRGAIPVRKNRRAQDEENKQGNAFSAAENHSQ